MNKSTMSKIAAVLSAAMLLLTGCSSSTTTTPSAAPSALMADALAAQKTGDTATTKAKLEELVATADIAKDQNLVVTAYFNLGVLAQAANDSKGALLAYKRALVIDPTYTPALFNIAVASTPINPKAAMTYYAVILSMNDKDANSLYNLGLLKWAVGEKTAAVKLIQAAIAQSPELAKKVPAEITLD